MTFRTLGIHNEKIIIEDYFAWINKYKPKEEEQVKKEKRIPKHDNECINERRRKKRNYLLCFN